MTVLRNIIIFFSICLNIFSCGGEVVGPAQNYSENQPPEILSLESDIVSKDEIIPQMTTTLTVNTSDPENETLKYEFSSDDGSFSGQESVENGVTVNFTVGNSIVSSQSVTVTVIVTDGHLNEVKKSFLLGTAKDGPQIGFSGDTPLFIHPNGSSSFSFRVTETCFYQLQVLSESTTDSQIAWDNDGAQRLCFLGDEVTVYVDGKSVSSSTADIKMDSAADNNMIAVVLRDSTGYKSHSMFILKHDGTAPVLSITGPDKFSDGTFTTSENFAVSFQGSDSADDGTPGCGKVELCYTTDGSDPDFSGTGTVIAMSNGGGSYTADTSIVSEKNGTYQLKYRSRDGLGNVSGIESVSYKVVTESTPPGEISGFQASVVDDNEIELTWTDNPTDADFDHVQIEISPNDWEDNSVFTVLDKAKTFSLTKIKDGIDYTITVKTVDVNGNVSDGVAVTGKCPLKLPGKPGLTVTELSSNTVTFNVDFAEDDDLKSTLYSLDGINYDNEVSSDGIWSFDRFDVGNQVDFYVKSVDFSGNESSPVKMSLVTPSEGTTISTDKIHYIDSSNPEILGKIGLEETYGLDDYYILMEDITLTEDFAGIGDSSSPFKGYFYGGGYTIYGLSFNASDDSHRGLFNYLGTGAEVRSINIVNPGIICKSIMGSIAGASYGASITDCHVTLDSSSLLDVVMSYVGGIVGRAERSVISGCSVESTGTAKISGLDYVGGISGYSYFTSIISCTSAVNVSAYNLAGGVTGYAYGDSSNLISMCGFNGTVTSTSTSEMSAETGGIVGSCYGSGSSNKITIEKSYSLGIVTGSGDTIGGIIGYGFNCKINNCFSLADIGKSGVTTAEGIGGLIGTTSDSIELYYSYFSGTVLNNGSNVDPLIGKSGAALTMNHTYFYNLVGKSHISESQYLDLTTVLGKADLLGKIQNQITVEGTTINVWERVNGENDDYPYLKNSTLDPTPDP